MSAALCDALGERRPWGDVEFRRFEIRCQLFLRRGMSPEKAEALADFLALRDQRKDDRRCCAECSHLQRSGTCFCAAQGQMPGVRRDWHPIANMLGRCERFEWVRP